MTVSISVGDRVGVMWGANAEKNQIESLGYGTYQGYHIPPVEVSAKLFHAQVTSPQIKLDNGKIVWGFETNWAHEEMWRRNLRAWEDAGWKIVEVDIDEARAGSKRTAGVREHEDVPLAQ